MTRLLTTLSDRLLGAVAPKAEAHAACTPRCGYKQTRCSSTGRAQERTCCLDYYCGVYNCSTWRNLAYGC